MADAVLLGVIAACASAVAPLPSDARHFDPPAVYRRWWGMVEACSGLTGDFAAVNWYEVPGSALPLDGEPVTGYWSLARNAIVIATDYARSGFSVRHEMLHALLHGAGHPREQFLGACSEVVDCTGSCVEDAGPWVRTEPYASVAPASVELRTEVTVEPMESDGERWITLHAIVENPTNHELIVTPPSSGPERAGFGFDVRGPDGGVSLVLSGADSSVFAFSPAERKEFLFEFVDADTLSAFLLTPGEYLMRAGYAGRWAPFRSVIVQR